MDFDFQGFQSNLPLWLILLLGTLALALSWWSYGKTKIPNRFKYGLIVLRGLVFLVLLILLLNPFYKAENTYIEKSKVLILLDNSASTSIQKGAYKGIADYNEVLDHLQLDDSAKVLYRIYSMGESIKPVSPDRLSFDEPRTKLFNAVELIKKMESEISGAILVSDGIFTHGRTPAFEASNLNVPVMTVALGDTAEQKDLIVSSINTEKKGYLNTTHPVDAEIVTSGFEGSSFRVQLLQGKEIIQQRELRVEKDRSTHLISFDVPLEEAGLNSFTVTIPSRKPEWTSANNRQSFAIDVIDEKQRILSLAFEIHPDVKFIRSLLERDRQTKLISRTWVGGDQFIEAPLDIAADTLDLVIVNGFPRSGLPAGLGRQVSTLLQKVPAILIASPLSDLDKLSRTADIGLSGISPGSREHKSLSLQLVPAMGPTGHPVMELPELNYEGLPPLVGTAGRRKPSAGLTTLFTGRFHDGKGETPLVELFDNGSLRRVVVGAYGWYRIRQSANPQHSVFVNRLFQNLISWSATTPGNDRLKIQPVKKVFSASEEIIWEASLTNESGSTESGAVIELTLSGSNIDKRFYSLENMGGGKYRLSIRALPEGLYRYTAVAKKGKRIIDEHQGELSVGNTNIEFVNTQRNDLLLNQIAERSGGSSFLFDQLEGYRDSLEKKGMLTGEEKTTDILFHVRQHSFWFILVILLLTAEWTSRKYLALS